MYREWPPPADLVDKIECIWEQRNNGSGSSLLRIPPDGSVDLIFDLAAHRSYWVGATAKVIVVPPVDVVFAYGIRFVPGAASGLLAPPINVLTDTTVAAQELGKNYDALLDGLAASASTGARLSALFAWAREQFKRTFVHPAVARLVIEIRRNPTRLTLEKKAGDWGMSRQYLTRLCQRHIGLDAKTFQRTQRLQKVLKTVRNGTFSMGDWSEFALNFGYFDQSHFINDFRDLTGETPSAFFSDKVPFFQDGSGRKR